MLVFGKSFSDVTNIWTGDNWFEAMLHRRHANRDMREKSKSKRVVEEDDAVVVGNTRVYFSQMETPSNLLGVVFDLLDKESAEDVREFIKFCDENGFAIVNWGVSTKR